jgi:hypothetical protein
LLTFHPCVSQNDSGFFGADSIKPFNADAVERDLKAKKFKTKDLELAVRQALDPSLLDMDEDDDEEEDDEEEEGGADEPEEPVKRTSARSNKKDKDEPAKKSVKVNGTRSGRKMDIDDDDQVIKNEKTPAKRRSRIIEDEDDNDVQEGHNHDRPSKMVRVYGGGAREISDHHV